MTEQGEQGEAESESGPGWLPRPAEELFGPGAVAGEAYDVLTVDVPPAAWTAALQTARDELGCTFFDWLSAVDEPDAGFRIAAHVVAVGTPPRRLLLRTTVPHGAPALATATGVYAGAAWHERETHEMFGVDFAGHPHLARLLLPEEFEGHPLRKDFVLAARVAKAWPGAKEPGEPHDGGPKRRQMQPPGVPDPNDWGPRKGTLPPAPARTPRRAGARAEGAPRRARTAKPPAGDGAEGTTPGGAGGGAGAGRPAGGARRARSASAGSASQRAAGGGGAAERDESAGTSAAEGAAPGGAGAGRAPRGARRVRSASEGSASQRAAGGGAAAAEEGARPRPRTPDAPWQRPRPDDESTPPDSAADGPTAGAPAETEPPAPDGPGPDADRDSGPSEKPPAGDSAPDKPAAGDPAPGADEGGDTP
jgi:NADH:ubiquinone oxidoreductase subunit C